jgi:hypothetical protein
MTASPRVSASRRLDQSDLAGPVGAPIAECGGSDQRSRLRDRRSIEGGSQYQCQAAGDHADFERVHCGSA